MSEFRYLFLDFDGVLHAGNPIDPGQRYVQMPLLATWLRRWPDVRVVITSSWRERLTLDELREIFPADLRHRVLGVTLSTPAGPARRDLEIRAWLAHHGLDPAHWAALDDDPAAFAFGLPCLVICDTSTGLTRQSLRELEEYLQLRRHDCVLDDSLEDI